MARLAALLLLAALLAPPAPSREACTCVDVTMPCQAAWLSPLVFAGTVTAITGDRVTFAVSEAFRGQDTAEIDLIQRNSSCDPAFQIGEAYLVYAHNEQEGPGWMTHLCTRTGKLKDRAEDLAYLRHPEKDKNAGRLTGQVMKGDMPVAGVRVTAQGYKRYEAITGSDGRYAIAVSSGEPLDVSFAHPAGIAVEGAGKATLASPHACAQVNGWIQPGSGR